jgi:NitT/TauT family transport system permease protein
MKVLRSIGWHVVSAALWLAAVCACWQIVVWLFQPPDYLLPPPAAVFEVVIKQYESLAYNSWVTVSETIFGFGLAVVGGIFGAILLGRSPRLSMVLWPTIMFGQITPKIALAPLLLAWFGFGLFPKTVIAFLMTFFPILIHTHAGFNSIEAEKEELSRAMRVGYLGYLLHFQFPHALPHIFSGARIAISLALLGAIVAEFVGADEGVGHVILTSSTNLDTPLLIAAVAILAVIGVALFNIVVAIEGLVIPWHISQRRLSPAEGGSGAVEGAVR